MGRFQGVFPSPTWEGVGGSLKVSPPLLMWLPFSGVFIPFFSLECDLIETAFLGEGGLRWSPSPYIGVPSPLIQVLGCKQHAKMNWGDVVWRLLLASSY